MHNIKTDKSTIEAFYETALAELGSALEMMAACKISEKPSHAYGYFKHAKDEYNHADIFKSILSKRTRLLKSEDARQYRFNASSLIPKGYISSKGYLIETMKIKDFIAFVYTNELLAKSSFDKILKIVGSNTSEGNKILQIMKDELRHHGMAKEHFLNYYPALQPWQLRLYKLKETISNKSRKIYYKNLSFLEIIFKPIYSGMAFIVAKLTSFVSINQFNRKGKNLMEINSRSML